MDDLAFSVDFSGYSQAQVLRALHDHAPTAHALAVQRGDIPPGPDPYLKQGSLDLTYAAQVLAGKPYIQYLKGRYIFVDFSTFPLLDPTKYDETNGSGCMEGALDMLMKRAQYEPDDEDDE